MSPKRKYPVLEEFSLIPRIRVPMDRRVLSMANSLYLSSLKWKGKGKTIDVREVVTQGGVRGDLVSPIGKGTDPVHSRAILFIHGGGFVFKAALYHRELAERYCLGTGVPLLAVDYALSYDSPYGKPLQDCIEAYDWLSARYSDISIVGDSAGGFLALKVALSSGRKPSRLLLVYPVVDCSMRTPSMAEYTDTPVWDSVSNHRMWEYYLQGNAEESLLDGDLSGLPPTRIETAQYDCLHDEAVLLAGKLQESSVPVTLIQTQGTVHGYDIVMGSALVQSCIEERIKFLLNGVQ